VLQRIAELPDLRDRGRAAVQEISAAYGSAKVSGRERDENMPLGRERIGRRKSVGNCR